MKKIVLSLLLLLLCCGAFASEPVIVIGSQKSELRNYSIVLPISPMPVMEKAAGVLQSYLRHMTGIEIQVVQSSADEFKTGLFIGRLPETGDPDGFRLRTAGTNIYISGGSHKGVLYGVYELLEKYLGCRFLAPDAEIIPKTAELRLPVMDSYQAPAFRSRETYYAGMEDPDFADKMRCDIHAWKGQGDWGMWVHTMFSLVPPDKLFEAHPEYYALMGGKRSKTQLCLTNPDVLGVTIRELKKKMDEKPTAKYWSVSQMDTYGYCECDKCKAIYEREGSPSGAMIEFVNKVAAAFPDKVISTLAYQYTRAAPKHVKPASNVNIMLCTIECDRNKPIAADTSEGSFFNDLRNWSKIAGDILVWDYVIQFSNMLSPFPNFHVLQPNIEMFKKYGVKSVFEQGCHGTYSENQELRQYILAKLLWNPELNMDSLETVFLNGYYGTAGNFIRSYLKMTEKNLVSSQKMLWIYGSPVQETNSFLAATQVRSYDSLFNLAEKTAGKDSVFLSRVRKARLPLMYAKLEIARKNITGAGGCMKVTGKKVKISPVFLKDVDRFVSLSNLYGVKTLHERGISPEKYRRTVDSSVQKAFIKHLATGKSYVLKNQPAAKYSADGQGTLTDGKRGFDNFHILWQGYENEDFEAVIDLGRLTNVNYLAAGFIQDLTSWIFYPEYVQYYVSTDGKNFIDAGRVANGMTSCDPCPIIFDYAIRINEMKIRYVKVFAKSILTCPEWHIGHGGKAWVFVDELIVDKR
ncbi:MAG: DUF4838 domain-containing protein [Bacteroidetes bacterium]|nr:DUF4838 domain-containing protein [Bacteroidota bacterium]